MESYFLTLRRDICTSLDIKTCNNEAIIVLFAFHYFPMSSRKRFRYFCVLERKGVLWRCEGGVDEALIGQIGHTLDLVVVEGKFAGQRTVQTRFGERGPRVFQDQRATGVVFAHAPHARIHNLVVQVKMIQ